MQVDNNYLVHHGITGQKWGQRNGPPYPLDASDYSSGEKSAAKSGEGKSSEVVKKKLSGTVSVLKARSQAKKEAKEAKEAEEKLITKTKVINSGDPKLIYQYRSYLNNKEFQEALVRVQNEKKLAEINKESQAKGESWVKKALADEGKALGKKAVESIGNYAYKELISELSKADSSGTIGKIFTAANQNQNPNQKQTN